MEERILIEYYRPIKELNDGSEDRIMNKLTRAEAIERMAKAFCETGAPNTWGLVERDYKRFCLAGAEAALNALLGG